MGPHPTLAHEIRSLSNSERDDPLKTGWHRPRPSNPGLFRKEVIQPQVLLRLPCYDFTPITDPTFGACLPRGLAQRLLVKPTFVV